MHGKNDTWSSGVPESDFEQGKSQITKEAAQNSVGKTSNMPNSEDSSAKPLYKQSQEDAKSKYFWAICIVSAVIILAAGATLAALYAPEHMPNTISKIVAGLSTTALYGITGGASVAGVAGVVGIGAAFYNNKTDGGSTQRIPTSSPAFTMVRDEEAV